MGKFVNKNMLEVHKPSSQVTCIYESKGKSCTITPTQHDSMNYICYTAREQISKNDLELLEKFKNEETFDSAFKQLRGTPIKIDLKQLVKFIDKYETNTKDVYQLIKELEDIKITVGHFKQDNMMVESRFSLISRTDRITNSNIISIYLEPELILGWLLGASRFAIMYLKIQTTLTRTYTKILYEICKDYINQGTVTREFELWKQVLHLEAPNISQLKGNYLNKSIIDINKFTDIKITSIFGKKTNGINSMTVEFEKQPESRLQELGLIQPTIIENKYYSKSKTKLDKLVKNGYKVIDEEKWIETDINNNQKRYDDETRIDTWVKETSHDDKNSIFESLASHLNDCNDPVVYIDDYKIVGVFSKEIFTKNPTETITMMNEVLTAMAENENDD